MKVRFLGLWWLGFLGFGLRVRRFGGGWDGLLYVFRYSFVGRF